MKTPAVESRRCFVSGIRARMDNQEWLVIVDENNWQWGFIPYDPREHARCYADARKCAESLSANVINESQVYDILERLGVAGVGPQGITKAIWKHSKVVDVVPAKWVMEFVRALNFNVTNPNQENEMSNVNSESFDAQESVAEEIAQADAAETELQSMREVQAATVEAEQEEQESAEAALVEHEVGNLPAVEVAVESELTKEQELLRSNWIRGLRLVANFFETHPEIDIPWDANWTNFSIFHQSKAKIVAAARVLGRCEKIYENDDFKLLKQFTPSVSVKLWGKRADVCEAKVIGIEHVPEKVTPAQPERIEPAHTKDVIEWNCKALLSDENEENPSEE